MNKIFIICVAVVAIGLVAIYIFKVPINNVLLYGAVLLCPLMHLLMMNHHGDHSDKPSEDYSKHS